MCALRVLRQIRGVHSLLRNVLWMCEWISRLFQNNTRSLHADTDCWSVFRRKAVLRTSHLRFFLSKAYNLQVCIRLPVLFWSGECSIEDCYYNWWHLRILQWNLSHHNQQFHWNSDPRLFRPEFLSYPEVSDCHTAFHSASLRISFLYINIYFELFLLLQEYQYIS